VDEHRPTEHGRLLDEAIVEEDPHGAKHPAAPVEQRADLVLVIEAFDRSFVADRPGYVGDLSKYLARFLVEHGISVHHGRGDAREVPRRTRRDPVRTRSATRQGCPGRSALGGAGVSEMETGPPQPAATHLTVGSRVSHATRTAG
jgi:hypothetical protein